MYTVAEVAELLKLHPKTVLRHIRTGRLAARKAGRSWRITQDALRAYTHAELASGPAAIRPDMPLGERLRVSAVFEIPEGGAEDAQRLAASLMALMNCKDPSWGPARFDVVHQPETGVSRAVLYGTPAFLSAALSAVEVFVSDNAS
ncbi:helix-turn-helix domain-containing protein [Sinisalibacter aestuarii]|uniref:2-hydroxyacid dehydrogenase n=1 Tax=Sinisalibacter aestuarii TaxID=2949426 RepID=A0ABQ5LPK9_9RHOB|nr:helix-turn-helix domain-containing protein [Sinisalibacter aestuarii]GKY86350.1 2-hydroxyacid dehydrogenase [Sinisalibacter aestuarii]